MRSLIDSDLVAYQCVFFNVVRVIMGLECMHCFVDRYPVSTTIWASFPPRAPGSPSQTTRFFLIQHLMLSSIIIWNFWVPVNNLLYYYELNEKQTNLAPPRVAFFLQLICTLTLISVSRSNVHLITPTRILFLLFYTVTLFQSRVRVLSSIRNTRL